MNHDVLDYARPRVRSRRPVGRWLAAVPVVLLVLLVLVAARLTVRRWKATMPARVAAARAEVAALRLAVDAFAQDVGRYPTTNEGLDALIRRPEGATGWDGPYFPRGGAMRDPWSNPRAVPRDTWGNPYGYMSWDGRYQLVSAGPDRRPRTADDLSASGPPARPSP